MEDILYFLFILAWLGISIYKGMQKRKSTPTPAAKPEPQQEKGALETLFEDFVQGEKTPEIYSEYESEPQNEPEKEFATPAFSNSQTSFSSSDYTQTIIKDRPNLDTIGPEGSRVFKERIPAPTQDLFQEDDRSKIEFDLKKAIVYDAVLNPPYI